VTGGLTFAGGPWNNYATHSIATMAERLVANPGQRGFITANGGYLTNHSFGVYGTEPPSHEFRWEDVQSDVDREPTRDAVVEWSGDGGGVDHTVQPDRYPWKAFLTVRTPDDARCLGDPHPAELTPPFATTSRASRCRSAPTAPQHCSGTGRPAAVHALPHDHLILGPTTA
jgi:acetyl-CoA C-acetyltransferase